STEAADYHFDFNGGKTLLGNHTRSNGTKEIVLVRYESDPAQFMWARTLASPVQGEDAIGASFCFGGDNDNIYLTGSFGTNSHHRMITAAYTNTGDLLWLKEFNRTSTSDDQGKTIQTDELGNPLVTGVSIDADTAVYVSVKYNQAETFFPPDTELAALPFAFYENKGQIINDTLGVADGVNYYTNTANPRIYLQNRQLSYVMNRIDSLQDSLQRIDLVFLGNPATKYSSGETKYYPNSKVNPYLNYYIGGLTNFQEHVEGYERIVEKNLYNNIDWHIYSNNSGLKYYFVVLPGGDPSDIVFKYLGATSVTSNSDSIIINTLFGTLIQAPFEAIQYNSTTATHISISCNSLGNSEFSFTLGSYDPNKPLYIKVGSNIQNITQSMANLQWSTYIGGGVIDEASKVRIDQNGNQFLCGNTESTNFPTTPGLVTNTNGLVGLFLTKYSTSNDIVWSTYYGGTQSLITDNQMNATSLAIQNSVDICGGGFSIFVGGSTTYSNLPLPGNGVNHNTTLASTTYPDMFITRFSGQSGIINYGTLIGSNGSDIINDMEVNEFTHNLFFVGYTNGSNFPYTNAFSGSGNFYDNAGKGIIGQLDCSMNFLWLTGYGSPTNGTCIDASPATNVKDIAFDTQKNIIISGGTPSAIPNTGIYAISNPSGSYYANRTAPTNCEDNGFIAKFTLLSGTNNKYQLYYKTHYGGSIESFCPAITSNSNDEIIFTTMGSPSGFSIFPNGSSLTTPNSRLFFSRFDKDGLPIYSNQVKSNNAFISSNEIKCNANNYCYIIGERYGSQGSIITANKTGYYYDDLDVGKKSVLIEVDPTNQVSWLSLFGGQTVEKGNSLDFFQNHLFICGETKSDQSSTDPFKKYPLADDGGYFDDSYNGNWDAYIAKLDISIATAIHDLDNNMIVNPIIYPNPNNGSFFIDFSSIKQKVYKAEITNTMGQLVFEETGPTKNLIPINTKLSNGIYIVSVCLDSTIYKYKIIINK
ncbi:MAG: T9SS type A sorting domain-containing protein, partial [Chitinophagales bacterium]|nr:T9SS type A sorting domain-containing protein [Chitinophagales bacterium]